MELHPKEFLRAVPASSELLFPPNDNNCDFDRLAYFARNQCSTFIIRHSSDCL